MDNIDRGSYRLENPSGGLSDAPATIAGREPGIESHARGRRAAAGLFREDAASRH